MGIAYAAPYVPPAPPVSPWRGIALTWTGWDGSEWELTNPAAGLFLRPGIRGLGVPTFERQSSSSPMVEGSRHRGSSTPDRDVFWPLCLYSDVSSAEFMERDRAFWRSLDPDLEGTWTAELPSGTKRTLRLRLSGADDEMTHDHVQRGWAKYPVNLLADKPYWRGETMRKSWTQSDLRNYYVTEEDRIAHGYAANVIHYLSNGGALGSASFTNDGDVPVYPKWTAVGPTTSVAFGVGAGVVIVPFAIPEGYAVQLDTDPVDGRVLWYGQWNPATRAITSPLDRTTELDPMSSFLPIPRGQDVPLSVAMTGTGTVIAEAQYKYRRYL